jgi:hypothetical protein
VPAAPPRSPSRRAPARARRDRRAVPSHRFSPFARRANAEYGSPYPSSGARTTVPAAPARDAPADSSLPTRRPWPRSAPGLAIGSADRGDGRRVVTAP